LSSRVLLGADKVIWFGFWGRGGWHSGPSHKSPPPSLYFGF